MVVLTQIIFNAFFAETFYIKSKEKQLTEIYYSIVRNYSSDATEIYNRVNSYEDEMNLRVFIYNSDLQVVYETLSNEITSELLSQYSLSQQGSLIKNFMWYPQVNLIKSYRNDAQTLAVRGSVTSEGLTNYIILEIPVSTIQQAVKTLNKYTFNVSLILMFVGVMIVYFFSYRLSLPIAAISRVAKNVANLDFSTKLPIRKGDDEINTLAKNINFMADELEKSIEDLKIANETLKKDNDLKQEVDNMRKEFIANVSHELKTPLSIMQGYTEMLKSDLPNIDKDFYYDVILDENRHMNELVTTLLNISKLDNGLTELQCESLDLVELCKWIVSKNEPMNEEIAVKFTTDSDKAMIFAEKMRIEQVITNFVSNAYNYANSMISVDIRRHDSRFRVSVLNNGEKISEQDLEKIWHSFYRADKARTRNKDKNFGLGLYIVKSIISAHNGLVGAYNTEDGVCFWFEIDEA
ncbi:MAG: HAMP domain-containing sensor histidine kinase [Clostridia bacterium]